MDRNFRRYKVQRLPQVQRCILLDFPCNGYRHIAEYVHAVALKDAVSAYRNFDDEIAGRTAVFALATLTAQGDAFTIVDAGGDIDGKLAVFTFQTCPTALLAGGFNEFTRASALLASGFGLEGHTAHTLDHHALARATAIRAGLG